MYEDGLAFILSLFLVLVRNLVRKLFGVAENTTEWQSHTEQLISELQNGNARERRIASYKISKSNDPQAVFWLIKAYQDEDSSVRQNAIDGLKKIGSEEALVFLNTQNLSTPEPPISVDANISAVIGAIVGYITMMIGLFIFFSFAGEDATQPAIFLCGVPGLFSGLIGGLIGNNILGPGKRGSVVGGALGGVIVFCVLLVFLRLLG